MKRKPFIPISFIFILFIFSAQAQFTVEEIAQREKFEELLQTADIIKSQELKVGVTKPWRLFLKKDAEEFSGCWKNPQGVKRGHLEGWRFEIAAYRMDKLLGINLIPPTVEREFDGKKGSLQLWVVFEFDLLEIMEQGIPLPVKNPEATTFNRGKYIARAFDSLIANDDRTQQNTLYTKDWRVILIARSRASPFPSRPK